NAWIECVLCFFSFVIILDVLCSLLPRFDTFSKPGSSVWAFVDCIFNYAPTHPPSPPARFLSFDVLSSAFASRGHASSAGLLTSRVPRADAALRTLRNRRAAGARTKKKR